MSEKPAHSFEFEGKHYLQTGLIQLWFNPKVCDKRWLDPIVFGKNLNDWLKKHKADASYQEDALCGVPTFVFTSKDLMLAFVKEFEIDYEDG